MVFPHTEGYETTMSPDILAETRRDASHSGNGSVLALSRPLANGQGRSRTYGVSNVTDLQSAAFATRRTYPNIRIEDSQ